MLPTDPPITPGVTGLSNGRWQTVQMGNESGNHLLAVNGVDKGIVYDATGLQRIQYVATPPCPNAPADGLHVVRAGLPEDRAARRASGSPVGH